ncbi:MAG: hypothetical protein AAEC10_01275 [Rhodospirillales bacterium]
MHPIPNVMEHIAAAGTNEVPVVVVDSIIPEDDTEALLRAGVRCV